MKSILYVEFVGVPGGGKTTRAAHLIDYFSMRRLMCLRYKDVFQWGGEGRLGPVVAFVNCFVFLVARPSLARNMWAFWCRGSKSQDFSQRSRRRKLVKLIALSSGVHRNSRKGVVVFDQGPLQCLMSWIWMGGHLTDEELRQVINAIFPRSMNSVFIHVDTDPATAFRRAKKRETQSSALLRGRTPDEAMKMFCHASSTVRETLRRLDTVLTIRVYDEDTLLKDFGDFMREMGVVI